MRKSNYVLGDYVKYEGNLSTLAEILRRPDFGRIDKIEVQHGIERIYLYLLGSKQHIWCDFQDIRVLWTEPEHLRNLGFITIDINGRKKYENLAVTISGCIIGRGKTAYLFNYCVGDFSAGNLPVERYFDGDNFLYEKFFKEFPDVQNLNDLFTFLKSTGRQIDEEAIILAN
jgi:hypothetical protein